MIKPIILSLAAATALAACSASEKQESPNVGVANPASEFCVKQGGKSEIKKLQIAVLHLNMALWVK